ncbi:MAG: hypothetical protein KGI41_01105 [Patescibacteria group bacterium]|nr:hypothetical protein [Patescibacteria group bacterium]
MRSPFGYFLIRIGWEFANTILLILSVIAFFLLAGTPLVQGFIAGIGSWGYFGALFTGFFFVSTFTAVPATVVLFSLAHTLAPLPTGIIAGIGAVVGDFVIFRFIRDGIVEEWMPVLERVSDTWLGRMFSSPFFAWFLPVGGALIIASPLPDEFGIGLLGIARLSDWQFLLLTLLLDIGGMLALVFIARLF